MPESLLDGIRVVDLSENLPGPFLSQSLTDLGASVIKVERPSGDFARNAAPGIFSAVNRKKAFERLDLKETNDHQDFLELLEGADILIEGFRPGTLTRLGLDPDDLMEKYPGLIIVSLCGYHIDSEHYRDPGHDITYAAYSGVLSIAGPDAVEPAWFPGVPMADLTASNYALSATLAVLFKRERTNKGCHIIVPITDALAHYLNPRLGAYYHDDVEDLTDLRKYSQDYPAYGIFRCKDGKAITIAALEDHFWKALITTLDLQEWLSERWSKISSRRHHLNEINDVVRASVARYESADLLARLRAADVPCAPILTPFEALEEASSRGSTQRGAKAGTEYFSFPATFRSQPTESPSH